MPGKSITVVYDFLGKRIEIEYNEDQVVVGMECFLTRNSDMRLPVIVGDRLGYIVSSIIKVEDGADGHCYSFYISDEDKTLSIANTITALFENLLELFEGKIQLVDKDLQPVDFDFSTIVEIDEITVDPNYRGFFLKEVCDE